MEAVEARTAEVRAAAAKEVAENVKVQVEKIMKDININERLKEIKSKIDKPNLGNDDSDNYVEIVKTHLYSIAKELVKQGDDNITIKKIINKILRSDSDRLIDTIIPEWEESLKIINQ